MAYVEVKVDIEDYLDEVSDKDLAEEVMDRIKRGKWEGGVKAQQLEAGVQKWTRNGLAEDIRTAFYARNAARLEMLLTVLEEHESRTVGLAA